MWQLRLREDMDLTNVTQLATVTAKTAGVYYLVLFPQESGFNKSSL